MTPKYLFYINLKLSKIEGDLYCNKREEDMLAVIDCPVFNAPLSSNNHTGTPFELEENLVLFVIHLLSISKLFSMYFVFIVLYSLCKCDARNMTNFSHP